MTKDQPIDISGGSNQVLPNATHAIQVFVGDDYLNRKTNTADEPRVEIMNMPYFSVTMPDEVKHEIQRRNYLDYCEKSFDEYNILCVNGENGVGVTTFLAQFVKNHPDDCASYFNNGLRSTCLNPDVIEQNLFEQLHWYAFSAPVAYEKISTLVSITNFVLRKIKQTGKKLYFVFDGFDDIPSEKKDGVKKLLSNLPWDKALFIFSGKKENIMPLLPVQNKLKIGRIDIIRFGEAEVKEYFNQASASQLSTADHQMLFCLTRGNAHRMDLIRSKFIEKGRIEELRTSDLDGDSDLYEEDCQHLFGNGDNFAYQLFALLAYAEFPLSFSLTSKILQTDENDLRTMLSDKYADYIVVSDKDIISLQDEIFHKYLRGALHPYRQDIELRIIDVLENEDDPLAYCNYLPAIYKSVNRTDKLIKYLNTGNVQKIMIKKCSQAALNEQCDYGFDACKEKLDDYAAPLFRFALNKSVSCEIEKNELWDNEIEALLAVGQYDQAIALTQSIYLAEERLKSYLLIAQKKKFLPQDDYAILKDNISQLVETIDFENIPDKAVELAKLLMPIDIEAATGLIERIAKKQKNIATTDKLYAMLSMAYSKDSEGNVTNFDLVNSKIQNDNLRSFTNTAKHLFDDMDVEQFLDEVSKLSRNMQKLYFLQFWLPDHEDKPGIGKVVLEGFRLIVAESDSEIPKARILNTICKSMRMMSVDDLRQAVIYLDAMGDTIKYPTFDYVDVELTIIESLKAKMPEKAKEMLEKLYFDILNLSDDSVKITCLAKLLGRYEQLGNKKELEKIIDSTVDIRNQITIGISQLLKETAYHLKVVEGPVKALVCTYPTVIDEIISEVNTKARRSRAYSIAAIQYLRQQDEEKIDLEYFFKLLSKTDTIYSDRQAPMLLMSDMLDSADKLDNAALLPSVKRHFNFVEEIESAKYRSLICMRIYLWLRRNFPEETFADKVKNKLLESWMSIDITWVKIEIGFNIAKNFAKISKEEACDMIEKCRKVKENCFLASSSCVDAYNESVQLYTLSLCNLIKLGLCDERMLREFTEDMNGFQSTSEKAIMWGTIALEYHLADKEQTFNSIADTYFPVDYSVFSPFDQKCIIYYISPALFFRSQTKFFTLLNTYDETFRNDCILNVCNFIIVKQNSLAKSGFEHKAYELLYNEYTHLLDLLEHSSDDESFFSIIDIICKSLRITNQKIKPLSSDQKKTVIGRAESIVKTCLPTASGIRHDGYKIACQAALSSLNKDFGTKDMATWQQRIDSIDNKADQAFLYFLIAPYFSKRADQQKFFEKGIAISETINSSYDKVRRLDMSISECLDYNLGTLVPDVARSVMRSLAFNGTLEDHKRLVDMAYQHDPELAEQLVDMLDNDPARMRYKRRLESHIASVKKLEQAKKDMTSIDNLNTNEQKEFFESRLSDLIDGKGQLYDVDKIFALSMDYIYNNGISDAHAAVTYLMETVKRKHQMSKNQEKLLFNIHRAMKYNLKLVLSLAAGTKDRLDKIESMIDDHNDLPCEVIGIGEQQKAIKLLLDWYTETGMNELIIIDPYFSPSDLSVVKDLTDINTDLSIKVVSHVSKHKPDDYRIKWRQLSSGVHTPITIHFVYFTDKPEDGPLHDRYWICCDNEHGKHKAIKPNSISGLGKKESSIPPVEESLIPGILFQSYAQYVFMKVPKKDDRELKYDKVVLE